jgi:glycosyltransferase involved in cell wall biosynthesis
MRRSKRVLFVQITEVGGYPPLIHASTLMADAGWEVTILNAPIAGHALVFPSHPNITIWNTRTRASHLIGKPDYIKYMLTTAKLAGTLRPDVVYASDVAGAAPGLFASRVANASLIYHEHDSPNPNAPPSVLMRMRRAAARKAKLVLFPNAERARIVQAELGFSSKNLQIVWNVPRRSEVPTPRTQGNAVLKVYYHGNISPELLPMSVVEALCRLQSSVHLRIVGYESPGARGYGARLMTLGRQPDGRSLVEYVGSISRERLLQEATQADIGLSLMPQRTHDMNLRNLVGASNKAFDYMAAGMALLVSDLPEWRRVFVDSGYALAATPSDPQSIAASLSWFLDHPEERTAMAARNRAKIEADWNYETAFAPVLEALSAH